MQEGSECGGILGTGAVVLSHAAVGGLKIALFSEGVHENLRKGFEAGSLSTFPGAFYAKSTP